MLGPLEVLRDGVPLEVGARKHRALLALLLLRANRVASADWLIEELWAGRPPPGAAKTLRSYVSRLRATIGDEVVRSRPPGYVLEIEPDQIDAHRFERALDEGRAARARGEPAQAAASLRAALASWYGVALADLADEPIASIEAARLEELRLVALEERIGADLDCGRHQELIAELEALVAEQPLRERLWGLLMTALYRSGRQADALDAYQRARGLLAERLGLDASEELRTLEQQILRQEVEPAPLPPIPTLPSGTVTLLFTDIEGSTRLLRELGARYPEVLAEHRRVLRAAFARHGGLEVDSQGDGFFVVFAGANEAVAAAADAQEALAGGPVLVRIGIHSGEPQPTEEGYVGLDVHRAARIAGAGHGGQVLLSQATRDLLDPSLSVRDLGERGLRDLAEWPRLYQLGTEDFPPLRAPRRLSLPQQLTSFVGREHELEELTHLLPDTPLLTLTGVGGCGKTRLALEAASSVLAKFPDGVLFVELAGLTRPELVPDAVAALLPAVHERSERPVVDVLVDHLRPRSLLLLLDNCEHLLEACSELAERLLDACPHVRILATSRVQLGLPGELVYRVPPLSLETAGDEEDDPAASEAVRLFLERAAAVGWEAEQSDETVATVASICRELDGLPLAVELAAARTQVLTVEEIAARLDDRFRFLRYWRRNPEPRHETLGATMAWSYELLTEDEKALLCGLSVFAGGFTLEAAAAVCLDGDTDATLELVTTLVESSLVLPDAIGGKSRYRMLETVRQYTVERLAETAEEDELRGRHAAYFTGDLQDAARFWPPDLWGTELFLRTNREIENMRAALDWAHRARSPLELPLAVVYQRADAVFPTEGRACLDRALANPSPQAPLVRARALAAAGGLARMQGDLSSAGSYLGESLDLYRANHDREGEMVVLSRLEEVAIEGGEELDTAIYGAEELARLMADPVMVSAALTRRAIGALGEGDRRAARQLLEQSLTLLHGVRNDAKGLAEPSSAYREGDARTLLALLEILDGDPDKAFTEAVAGLRAFSQVSEDYGGKWDSIDVLAAALARTGGLATGVRLYAAVNRYREMRGEKIPWALRTVREQTHSQLEQALAEPEFAAEAEEGRRMTLSEATTAALRAARSVPSQVDPDAD
jgi:predicted ATPase/DNA-binding SARP family transcriptional activator